MKSNVKINQKCQIKNALTQKGKESFQYTIILSGEFSLGHMI